MSKRTNNTLAAILGCLLLGGCIGLAFLAADAGTSSNAYCMSCHYHEEADMLWKQSPHYINGSGVVTDCIACHLPPKEQGVIPYYMIKARMGAKDIWSKLTKDKDEIDWAAKRDVEYAAGMVRDASCLKCHANLFPEGVTDDGIAAHLYYEENVEKLGLSCISCHLNAGHYIEGYTHGKLQGKIDTGSDIVYEKAAEVTAFEDFTETVPGTGAAIDMVAIPGGEFLLGSPDKEAQRQADEGPQKRVRLSPFFMARTEITWTQYWNFYNETMSEGRTPPATIYALNSREDLDAVSGPTPPFGYPDQGWGMGERPAITMTHYAAETFCQWLSLKTGRKYRLPTEAEWEYAARGGQLSRNYKFSGSDNLEEVAWCKKNSGKTIHSVGTKQPNEVGVYDMSGNVYEWCFDGFDMYEWNSSKILENPTGYNLSETKVYRGGCMTSYSDVCRVSARSQSIPNAKFNYVGFRLAMDGDHK